MDAPPEEFIVTKEYRRFGEFADAVRRDRYIGLCYGTPGVGKTLSTRHYARWDLIESARPGYFWRGEPPAAALPCRTVVYTAPVVGAPRVIERDVREGRQRLSLLVEDAVLALHSEAGGEAGKRVTDYTELLIVDEADRLKLAGLEQVRDIYDRDGIGLILVGMPGLEKRMARYPQLYSRVGFVHHYRPLGSEELRFVLEHKWEQLGRPGPDGLHRRRGVGGDCTHHRGELPPLAAPVRPDRAVAGHQSTRDDHCRGRAGCSREPGDW